MKRRDFIQNCALLATPVLVNGIPVASLHSTSLFDAINGDNDHVLVLINLVGGNDGLNTLIPLDQYSKLVKARSAVLIKEPDLVGLTDVNSFHPSFAPMKGLFEEDKLGIIQNVGYADQNRSHFRSSDIWNTASAADEVITTGWLGRYFEGEFPDYPSAYPSSDCPDPFAITVGNIITETCQGTIGNFSIAVKDPSKNVSLQESESEQLADGCYKDELSFLREVARQTNAYFDAISQADALGDNIGTLYDDEDELAQKLKIVARLISGGLRTKVYVVSLGGFDTHANQVDVSSTKIGEHAELLGSLSNSIAAFQDDISKLGLEERVLGMTYSEFGRRIQANFSYGTDHGSAAPLFLFGSCVKAGIIGDNPEIPENVGLKDGVAMQFDFRDIYGSVLMDWFGAKEADVKNILYEDFNYLQVIQDCQSTGVYDEEKEDIDFQIYPNPCANWVKVSFEASGEHVRISVFDTIGNMVKMPLNKRLNAGSQTVNIELHQLLPANYFIQIVNGRIRKTKAVQKL